MAKKILIICLLFLTSCVGCRSGSQSLTVYLALLPVELEAYQEIVDAFTQETGLPVQIVAGQYADIRQALAASGGAGQGVIDVVEVDVYTLAQVAPDVLPLSSLQGGAAQQAVYPAAWGAGEVGGDLKFVPHRLAWQALVYNAKRLGKPPATWEELLQMAKRYPGKLGLKASFYEGLSCELFPFIWQAGGDPAQMDDPKTIQAMAYVASLASLMHPSSVTYKENTILEAQEREEVYLHQNWPFVVPVLMEKQLLPSVHRVAPLPRGPVGAATVLGGGYLAIPKSARHPEAALQFLQFMMLQRTQEQLVRKLGWFPIREDAWGGLSPTQREAFGGFLAMADHVHPRPVLPNYETLSASWQQAFREIVWDHAPVAATLKKYARQLE